MGHAVVDVAERNETFIIICLFRSRASPHGTNNVKADKKTATILAQKALYGYLDVKQDEILNLKGMESSAPEYLDGKVKICFAIPKENCEVAPAANAP